MLKRALLAFTFIAALATGGLGMAGNAAAWHDCDDDYGYSYGYRSYATYAPRVVYYSAVPVRSYPVFYGRGYDSYDRHRFYDQDDHHHHHGHHDHDGVRVTFGF